LNTAITLDPEIIAGPIIYQIEVLFELYNMTGRNLQTQFFRTKFTCFHQIWWEKNDKLWLNTVITPDPEIVAGPIIYQIEALFELYKIGWANPANAIFSAIIHLFSSVLEEKNYRIVAEVGHNFCSRNRSWDYNIPNRSSYRTLQIMWGEICQPNLLGKY